MAQWITITPYESDALRRFLAGAAPFRQGDAYGYGEYCNGWEHPLPESICALLAIRDAACAARDELAAMTPEERLIAFARYSENYCRDCGRALQPSEWCYCTKDIGEGAE